MILKFLAERHAIADRRRVQTALHSRLGWTENAFFLEQFRYVIVASQLLNEHSNPNSYKRQKFPPPSRDRPSLWETDQGFVPSPYGLLFTGVAAFALALSIRWLHKRAATGFFRTGSLVTPLVVIVALVIFYYCFRRQWLHYLRSQAVENASTLTTNAQEFDAAAFAGITLIQEVELVSRGYNMYAPCHAKS